jgi:hypothetical protein
MYKSFESLLQDVFFPGGQDIFNSFIESPHKQSGTIMMINTLGDRIRCLRPQPNQIADRLLLEHLPNRRV